MPNPKSSSDAILEARADGVPDIAVNINEVLQVTSLNAIGSEPSRLANLCQANVTASTNHGVQNAIANQQAMQRLGLAVLGNTVNRVANLGPLQARSAVDALTGNEVAELVAILRATVGPGGGGPVPPFKWKRLLELLKPLLHRMREIEKENERLKGDGSREHPFEIKGHPLFARAGTTLAFVGVRPEQLDLAAREQVFTKP